MPRKANAESAAGAAETKNVVKKPVSPDRGAVAAEQEAKQSYRVKNALTPNMFVTVRSGFNGRLVYKSSRTQEKFVWEGFGSEQDIELQELKNAKSAHKAYFENNWFMFDDPEIIHYLGVEKMYASSLNIDEFDELFDKSPDEIKDRIATIPEGQKLCLAYRAKQKIEKGEIDSIRTIHALEESLSTELIER